ncbi:MAG: putative rane protein, partial [Dehalococcoidia bacterium]|nr:putative rane protein [Dehalococcoidia bacterium]
FVPFVVAWFSNFAIPLFCLIWNPIRRSVWGPPAVSISVMIGTFADRVRLYVGPFSIPDEDLKHHMLENIPATHMPDFADILIIVGWIAGAVMVYLLATKIIPTISAWEMKEGMLLYKEREYSRSKVVVLGKPQ